MIGQLPALRAELLRTKGSAAAWLTLIGIPIAIITTTSGTYATPDVSGRSVFMWQALFVTGMSAPLLAVIAGLTSARELRAREGGTTWRPVRPAAVTVARFAVLAGLVALLELLVFGLTIPLGALLGQPVDPPAMLEAAVLAWASSLGFLAAASVLSEAIGVIAAFLTGCAWQLIGTLCAESALWWAIPPTWSVRAMLPVLGIHANATPLAAADELASAPVWPAIVLSSAAAVLILSLRPLLHRRSASMRGARDSAPVGARSLRPGPAAGIRAALRGRGIGILCAMALLLCLAAALVYRPAAVIGFYSFLLLPAGAVLLAGIAWLSLAPGWRLLLVRSPHVAWALPVHLLTSVCAVTLGVWALAAAFDTTADDAMGLSRVAAAGFLCLLLGGVQTLAALWLAVRLGPGWALGLGIGGIVVSATFGGDVLAASALWMLGPTGWPLTADTPGRLLIAAVVCTGASAVFWALAVQALRTAPLREGSD